MSLVLYNPVSSPSKKPILPLSLLALGALIEDRVDYEILDGNLLSDPLAELSKRIRAGADTLACTVMPGPQLNHVVPLCRELKQRHPQVRIIWGGYFPTQHFEICLRADYVDVVVRGHGELPFAELINQPGLAAGTTPRTGLVWRDDEGQIIDGGTAAVPNPGDFPDFPYHRVDVAKYARSTYLGKRTLSHHSSYGCPFFCNFCAVVNMVGGAWKAQSAERTASVVDRFVEHYGADSVEFWDNNFFVHQARTLEFSERIAHHDLRWWGEARIDTMLKYRDETWCSLRDSGLAMVYVGAESGSNETLRRMDKGGTSSVEKTLEFAAKSKQYDIVPEMSFMLGNPPNPEEDAIQTIEFIRQVKRVNPETEIIFYLYTPVPLAGDLYDEAKASGFAFPDTLEGWVDPAWQEVVRRRSGNLPWMKDPIVRRVRDFERVLNAYYPTVTDQSLLGLKRSLLQALAAWRYKAGFYAAPYELAAFHRLFGYQRPETSGF